MNYDHLLTSPPGVRFNAGEANVKVWAPEASRMHIVFGKSGQMRPLTPDAYGFWVMQTDELRPGDSYWFVIGEGDPLPDPATLFQADGVHGASTAFDVNGFEWTDGSWKNIALNEYIIYELHVGTFTDQGTFAGVEKKLDYLAELGVNAIEIMPVSQFAGDRNWGYDGVFPYSVQNTYGGPEALQQFVDACHRKGIAVILDMVYNHLGPEGNVLGKFGPYFTDKYHTPWGDAINFDDAWSDGVRHYFVQNALMWFRDFHIDALRLDAVHAIKDFSPKHILQEIREQTDALANETGRPHYLIVEMDLNDTRFIRPVDAGGYGMDAQWIDEFHHALRVSSGQEKTGYYSDFDPITSLAKSYRGAYVYDGIYSEHRKRKFGMRAEGFPGHQFIVFSQNHDHIGNRMLGERTSQLVSFEMQKLLAGAVFVSPFLPLLFMGEEFGETNPFQYFVSHTDTKLAHAVREGRKREFAAFHLEGEAPDPLSEVTFRQSKLQWELCEKEPHRHLLSYYQKLIDLKKRHPALTDYDRDALVVDSFEEKQLIRVQRVSRGHHVAAILNFSKSSQEALLPSGHLVWHKLLASSDPDWGGMHTIPEQHAPGTITVPVESFTLFGNIINS